MDEKKEKVDKNVKNGKIKKESASDLKVRDEKKKKSKINVGKPKTKNGVDKKEEVVKENEKLLRFDNDNNSQEKTKSKRENKYTIFVVFSLIVACVSLIIGSVITYYALSDNLKHGDKLDTENNQSSTANDDLSKLIKIYNEIISKHYFTIDKEDLIEGAINGMLDMTGDPHSTYLDPESSKSFDERMKGTYYGIGTEIVYDVDGNVYFYNIFKDTPAFRAGIQTGDRIKAVDGTNIEGMSLTDVTALIKHDDSKQKTVTITYEREGKDFTTSLTTELINIPSVYQKVYTKNNKKIGYILITIFAENTALQYLDALNDMKRENVDAIIIDVRDNSGGYLSTVDTMLENSLPSGSIKYQMKTKNNTEKEYVTSGNKIEVPIVILQNTGSASGSEMLSVSYRDNYNATIIGTTSYGKNTVQGLTYLSDGSVLKYTIKEWLSPIGESVSGNGIAPSLEVQLNEEYYITLLEEDDNQLQTALDYLTK